MSVRVEGTSKMVSTDTLYQTIKIVNSNGVNFIMTNTIINDSIDEFTPLIVKSEIQTVKGNCLIQKTAIRVRKEEFQTINGENVEILSPCPWAIDIISENDSIYYLIKSFGGKDTYFDVFNVYGKEIGYKYFFENVENPKIYLDSGNIERFYLNTDENIKLIKRVKIPYKSDYEVKI